MNANAAFPLEVLESITLSDKLFMVSRMLDFAIYSLSLNPGDVDSPEKTSSGLRHMLGQCQDLVDSARHEAIREALGIKEQ